MIRGKLVLYFFFVVFGAIFFRLLVIQVIEPHTYAADYLQKRKILPDRGRVYDRNSSPLAVNQNMYRLYVEPKKITDKKKVVEALDEVLKMGEATIEARIRDDLVWAAVKGGITSEEHEAIMAKNLDGVGFEREPSRFYPESSLSAHLVGFLGKDNEGESIGYFGIEGYYNQELIGLPGYLRSERDAFNKPIFVGTQDRTEAVNGRDLILTVDKSVQNIVKSKLKDAMEAYEAKQVCATVADPNTMEILAMSCLPDFDPEIYYEASPEAYINTTISNLYEPGSTFKPLIMAAAINEKKINPLDSFNEAGPLEISGYTIQNWNKKYIGEMNMSTILERSSNIGMVYIGTKLGNDLLYKYLDLYGFGKPTGIDLQGETGGTLRDRSTWYPIDYATATFGQGIAITQLQLVRAFASLINGGYLMKPYVVKEIRQGDRIRVREPEIERRVLSEYTSEVMKKMLQSSVDNAEMKFTFPKEYKIGGKTGTAQVAVDGSYDASKTIASFIGFAPVEDPKFISLVVVVEPKSSIWGSETAAPVFFEIAKELFVYYNIVPEQGTGEPEITTQEEE